jgi:hypothetical protein
MSIGTVIADADTFEIVAVKYHVLPKECQIGGMYSDSVFLDIPFCPILCTREEAIRELKDWFAGLNITKIFAYNANFDRGHLPELQNFAWFDIMRLAAYRQYNPAIPDCADCFATGRLKRGYGVEPMLRLLSGKPRYRETHNAVLDALDELSIMRLLGIAVCQYIPL